MKRGACLRYYKKIDNNIVFVEIMGSQMEGVMATKTKFRRKIRVGDRIKVFVKVKTQRNR